MYQKDTEKEKRRDTERDSETHVLKTERERGGREGEREKVSTTGGYVRGID